MVKRSVVIDDYFALKSVESPIISPDGKWVVYWISTKDLENDRSESRLWMVPTEGGEARPITPKASRVGSPGWTSDSQSLLVVYPNAHHGIRKHSSQKDLLERFLAWFEKYVKNAKPN